MKAARESSQGRRATVGTPSSRKYSPPRFVTHSTWPATKTPSGKVLFPEGCRVPECPNKNCKLTSHRLYDPSALRHVANRLVVKRVESPEAPIGREGVDGIPQLPIDDALDSQFRALFHHFFDSVFDRLADIFRGPLLVPGYKTRMLGVALSNRAYCMGLITQAHTDMALSRGAFQETRDSLELYTRLIAIFRTQLAASTGQGRPDPMHIELALLVLCILLSYNVTRGRLSELRMNWAALRHLVSLRGGVHYLTVSLAYVVHVDRLCATTSGVLPTYMSSGGRLRLFNRPPWSKYSPGFSRLETSHKLAVDVPIREQCLSTCELLALYDAFHSPKGKTRQSPLSPPPSPEYLYYLRDQVDEQFAILYARTLRQDTPSRCILLATRIVEYPVTWANYVPTMTMDLCGELCGMLRRQDLFECWSDSLDILSWVLFVMLASPWPFEDREWAVMHLRGIIGAKYGVAAWPEEWRADELRNLLAYAWNERHFASRLEQVFRELEMSTSGSVSKGGQTSAPSTSITLVKAEI
ncbi:hypothetical protein PV11_07800 [Exophiala sideris]|uniref:Transcription factor domain-containing protein n=1 Tax=Exophiala sideris TaxID=1016849 RepID=A0A0D1YB92_9EURO|nr:hypothetical protein PV11_07800 [Exophiala sideris]